MRVRSISKSRSAVVKFSRMFFAPVQKNAKRKSNINFNSSYVTQERFARKCDGTGKGMNEGFVVCDGDKYFSNEDTLLTYLLENTKYLSIDEAWDDEYCYWTQWEQPSIHDNEFYLLDGTCIEFGYKLAV